MSDSNNVSAPPPLLPGPPPSDPSTLLPRLPRVGPPPPPPPLSPRSSSSTATPRQTREQTDETCWTFSSQTNARRALGLEPQLTMYCYLNFRNSLNSLVPVKGHPNAFLARDSPRPEPDPTGPGELKEVVLKSTRTGDQTVELPRYSWPWLDGRYWYVARGKHAVEQHWRDQQGSTSWQMIETIQRRQQSPPEPSSDLARAHHALGIVDLNQQSVVHLLLSPLNSFPGSLTLLFRSTSSESLTSLSTLYSTSLQRLHAHVLRIYTPLWTSLTLLPKTYTDGTQLELLSTCYTRLTNGSAFDLVGKLWTSLDKVNRELRERREASRRNFEQEQRDRKRRGGPPSVEAGFGGVQPRVPPRSPS
ncbi:uncharacterized protein JCM15063_003190 [Sporobolomyces koalae]|uniref:uncharacterized protein n=1 Tax=Sporobolomyces koalae TaxID=500713 RepID=UPI0031788977